MSSYPSFPGGLAAAAAEDSFRLTGLELYVEVTQLVQFFGFHTPLGSATPGVTVNNAAAPINSVPLVAYKPTLIRAYVREVLSTGTSYAHFPIVGTATITGATTATLTALQPASGGDYQGRSNITWGASFLLPWDKCAGSIEVAIRVEMQGNPRRYGTATLGLKFHAVPSVPVTGLLISTPSTPAVSGTDFVVAMGRAMALLPSFEFVYRACVPLSLPSEIRSLSDWQNLASTVFQQRSVAESTDLYVALMPKAPPNSGARGISYGFYNFVAVAGADSPEDIAHEIGHALGRYHVLAGNQTSVPAAGTIDPAYPQYGTYMQGSTGEFGINLFGDKPGAAFDPQVAADIMSYGNTRGVSPYTYVALQRAILDAWDEPDTIGFVDPMPKIKSVEIHLTADEGERFELRFAAVRECSFEWLAQRRHPRLGEYRVEVLTESDQVWSSATLEEIIPCQGPGTEATPAVPKRLFGAIVPWREDIQRVQIRKRDAVAAIFTPDSDAPTIAFLRVERGSRDLCRLSWSASHPRLPVTCELRYSADGGTSWLPVPVDGDRSTQVVNLDLLAGGPECHFQLITSAGFRTTTLASERFEKSVQPRRASIIQPRDGALIPARQRLHLIGGAHSPDFKLAPGDRTVWTSNRDGILGSGQQVSVSSLSLGHHRITLTVDDGCNGQCSNFVSITVSERGPADRLPGR